MWRSRSAAYDAEWAGAPYQRSSSVAGGRACLRLVPPTPGSTLLCVVLLVLLLFGVVPASLLLWCCLAVLCVGSCLRMALSEQLLEASQVPGAFYAWSLLSASPRAQGAAMLLLPPSHTGLLHLAMTDGDWLSAGGNLLFGCPGKGNRLTEHDLAQLDTHLHSADCKQCSLGIVPSNSKVPGTTSGSSSSSRTDYGSCGGSSSSSHCRPDHLQPLLQQQQHEQPSAGLGRASDPATSDPYHWQQGFFGQHGGSSSAGAGTASLSALGTAARSGGGEAAARLQYQQYQQQQAAASHQLGHSMSAAQLQTTWPVGSLGSDPAAAPYAGWTPIPGHNLTGGNSNAYARVLGLDTSSSGSGSGGGSGSGSGSGTHFVGSGAAPAGSAPTYGGSGGTAAVPGAWRCGGHPGAAPCAAAAAATHAPVAAPAGAGGAGVLPLPPNSGGGGSGGSGGGGGGGGGSLPAAFVAHQHLASRTAFHQGLIKAWGSCASLDALDEGAAVCSICIGCFREGALVTTLPCGHCYHKGCILPWLLQQGRARSECPLCKGRVFS